MIGRTAALGAALALVAGLIGWRVAGPAGLVAAGSFGLFATLLQTAAVALVVPALKRPWDQMFKRWLAGMGLRLLGVVGFGLAAWLDRAQFPPLMAGLGLVGVMVPLLFYEGRLLR